MFGIPIAATFPISEIARPEHPSSSPRVAADYWTPACPIADRRSPGDPEHISSSAQSCGQVLYTHNGYRVPVPSEWKIIYSGAPERRISST